MSHRIERQLDRIERKLNVVLGGESAILKNQEIIMSAVTDALDRAEAAAKDNADAEDAVIALLGTLSSQIADLKANVTDPGVATRIQALADAVTAKKDSLAAAIVLNTPAASA